MEFCPKCETRMTRIPTSLASLHCPKCGYKTRLQTKGVSNHELNNSYPTQREIAVLDKEKLRLLTFPTIQAPCPKCGNIKAETWTVSVGSEGASSVTFFRCTSCGRTRRQKE